MASIKTKLSSVILFVTIIPLSVLGIFSYYKTTEIFTNSVQDALHTILKSKSDALSNYIESTENLAQGIADHDSVQEYIAVKNTRTETGNARRLKELENEVSHLLYSFQEAAWGKYHHVFLIDETRRIAISPNHGAIVKGSPSSHLGEVTSRNSWVQSAFSSGETTVSDYASWTESNHIHQMLFHPVKSPSGEVRALLGFELQIPYEQEIMTTDFELGETGRIILATTQGLPILYEGVEAESEIRSLGVIEAQANGYSSGRRLNAAGVDVIDLYLKDDKYPWILIAEIESQEVYRDLNDLQKYLLLGFLLTVLFAIFFSVFFSNYIVNPIKRLFGQMEQISLGKFNVQLEDTHRNDEIGALVKAFSRVIASLKIAMKHYLREKKNND